MKFMKQRFKAKSLITENGYKHAGCVTIRTVKTRSQGGPFEITKKHETINFGLTNFHLGIYFAIIVVVMCTILVPVCWLEGPQ